VKITLFVNGKFIIYLLLLPLKVGLCPGSLLFLFQFNVDANYYLLLFTNIVCVIHNFHACILPFS
jgi:hypothetical protein